MPPRRRRARPSGCSRIPGLSGRSSPRPITCAARSTGIAGAGVPARQLKKLALPLDDSNHPLISALTNGSAISFHNPRDARLSVFGDAPFTSVKVGGRATTRRSA